MKKHLVSRLLLIVGLCTLSMAALSAEITPHTSTCAQAQAILVAAQKATINTTSIFGRPLKIEVVATHQCLFGTTTRPVYFKTLDVRQCFLGYHAGCEEDSAYEGGG